MKKLGKNAYLNPNIIASGIGLLSSEEASFYAGRILIQKVQSIIARGDSFAFESTLSGRTWTKILKNATDQGYQVTIYFLYLSSIKKNLQRIKNRVQLGGHSIPAEAVHRRHPRCFDNFWTLYRPLCTNWYIFDNSGTKPQSIQNNADFENLSPHKQQEFVSSFLKAEIP